MHDLLIPFDQLSKQAKLRRIRELGLSKRDWLATRFAGAFMSGFGNQFGTRPNQLANDDVATRPRDGA